MLDIRPEASPPTRSAKRRKYLPTVLAVVGMFFVLALLLAFLPQRYTAHALVSHRLLKPGAGHAGNRPSIGAPPFVQGVVSDPAFIEKVLADPAVTKLPAVANSRDSAAWVRRKLHLESIENSELWRLSFTCASGADAAAITNAALDGLLDALRERSKIEDGADAPSPVFWRPQTPLFPDGTITERLISAPEVLGEWVRERWGW